MMYLSCLGKTEFKVSKIGFGAWAIGSNSYGLIELKDAHECIQTYLDYGGNFIDTARVYGDSEKIIGDYLSGKDIYYKIYICSKTMNTESREQIPKIKENLEQSLRMLKRDYIDLYYLHSPTSDMETLKYILEELESFKAKGKIRSIGASIKGPDVTETTQELCLKYSDFKQIDVIQLVYSILRQQNDKIFDQLAKKDIGIVARTVLESGFLTDKYLSGYKFNNGDHRLRWGAGKQKLILNAVTNIKKIISQYSYNNLAEFSINFAAQNPFVSTLIIGAKNKTQMISNINAFSGKMLNDCLVKKLKEIYWDKTHIFNTEE